MSEGVVEIRINSEPCKSINCRCSEREADEQAHAVLRIFFQFIQNWFNLKNQNGCLILPKKFPIFAYGSFGIL
jgi:hypothetical protein